MRKPILKLKSASDSKTIAGFLTGYWGQGERGAIWFFQDENFIFPDRYFWCLSCGLIWDKHKLPDEPPPVRPGTYCYTESGPGEHHEFVPGGYSSWSSDGWIALRNDDHLTVFDKDDTETIIWSGIIQLTTFLHPTKRYRDRPWEEYRQHGVDPVLWKSWFEDNYPGKLTYTRSER